MKKKVIRWYYRHKYQRAVRILNSIHKRHKDAGHEVHYSALKESHTSLVCIRCPEEIPLRRRPEDVRHATVDRFGNRI